MIRHKIDAEQHNHGICGGRIHLYAHKSDIIAPGEVPNQGSLSLQPADLSPDQAANPRFTGHIFHRRERQR